MFKTPEAEYWETLMGLGVMLAVSFVIVPSEHWLIRLIVFLVVCLNIPSMEDVKRKHEDRERDKRFIERIDKLTNKVDGFQTGITEEMNNEIKKKRGIK